MASELIDALQALAHERKIDEFYLIERLEASLAKSYERILDLEEHRAVLETGKLAGPLRTPLIRSAQHHDRRLAHEPREMLGRAQRTVDAGA